MSEKRQFNFIRRNQSVRKDKKRDEEGTLARWLRELRGSGEPKTPAGLDRSNPAYHSEGKGQRKKNAKEKRRHSFNQKPQTLNPRCCGEREDGGRKERRLAMTGGTAKSSSQYIINTSPPDRCRSVIKGHEKGLSWGGEEPPSVRPQRNNSFSKQLKTVMERCEKMPPGDKFLPKVDRDGKTLGDSDYSIPSPPERDLSHLDHYGKYNETRLSQLSIDGGYDGSQTSLTRAELEQYSRTYEDVRPPSHSQQPSYAQSEGYHSYVSSADSTSTPFLDRLRREHVENNVGGRESSASSGSSSETLKWHGSLSDVSASHTQHIAHSARVPMPQRHHSESVLYLDPWPQHTNLNSQMRRLFPVTTYEPTSPRHLIEAYSSSRSPPKLSVAERISEIERQSQRVDDKRKMTDHASLKAIQKKALLSFYERHHSAWKSEPQLTTPSIPPQPPPRPQPLPSSRRSSSASDYAGAMKREIPRSHHDLSKLESNGMPSKHQHSSSCGSLSTAVLGPMIIGPSISVDDWVPARPPKKPHLRVAYQPRALSPDLPPPSPPPVTESEVFYSDEPLPPPPVEVLKDKKYDRAMNASMSLDNLTRSDTKHYENGESKHKTYQDKFNEKYVENRIEYNEIWDKKNYIDMRKYDEIMSPPLPNKGKRHHDQPRSLDSNLSIIENNQFNKPGPQTPKKISYKNIREHFIRSYESRPERQSLRITTSSQKLLVNGKIANAVHNGKISPPSRKANLVRTPSDVVRRVSYSIGIHHAEPLSKQHSEILNKETFAKTSPINSEKPSELFAKSPPSLPPHCPPTTLQLSQSKASSYLAYRRETKEKEKGLPDFQGSYKRTMSPSGGRIIENSAEKVTINEIEIKKEITKKEDECEKKEEPASQEPVANCDKETAKTLPRNYSLAVANKRSSRPPRAQSDPTSAKVEKKSVSASTQDNLDESREEKPTAVIARSQSDRTGESRVIDAASQTTPSPSPPPSLPRRQLQEEIECEQLSRDLASQLSPSHKLHGILVPGPEVKRTTDYVSGLFRMDFTPRSRSSLATQSITTQTNGKGDDITTNYLTAECKARLLSLNTENTQNSSMSSLQQKKEELMMRLSRKLSVLKEESIAVSEETSVNEALGEMVSERIEKVARPQEIAKFRLHVKEVGHITSLLLSLSGRLARAENALLITNLHDRKTLEEKRDKLLCQLNEAKQLKSNIDQRSVSVSTMLYNYLTGDEYTDYDHFINMKSKLLVDAREIADKIQLGEEQLAALKETLDQVR